MMTIFKQALTYKQNCVYVFGHSLDVTDGDILREIIETPGFVTVIFYKDKQQQAQQIAKLSKILTQDKLLEYTFNSWPKIIFQQQTDMKSVENRDTILIPV